MPASLLGPLIAGGAQLLGGGLDALSQGNLNWKNRRFAREMYALQKADNYQNWLLQNEYNSPEAQMQRYREAGLNPNLIYGQGNSGNASPLQTADMQTPQTRSPEWGGGVSLAGLTAMNAIYDFDIKQATIDNLKAQNNVIMQEALLKAAQTKSTEAGTNRSIYDLDFETEHRSISSDARREELRRLKTTTDLAINEDARRATMNATNIAEAAERMLTMQEQRASSRQGRALSRAQIDQIRENINLMRKDGTLKDFDISLRKLGLNPADPTWMRAAARLITDLFSSDISGDRSPGSMRMRFWELFGK